MVHKLAAPRPGVGESTLVQAYWCSSRLVNHGWHLHDLGCDDRGGYFTAHTPNGQMVTVRDGTSPPLSLQAQLCTTLGQLAEKGARDGADYLHYLSVMLRVRPPATRLSATQVRPWPIPGYPDAQQPPEEVRIAYWLSSLLVDDYGWQITDLDRQGFTAITPSQSTPVRYSGTARHNGTTAAEFTRRLGTLTDAEVAALSTIVQAHRRYDTGKPKHRRREQP